MDIKQLHDQKAMLERQIAAIQDEERQQRRREEEQRLAVRQAEIAKVMADLQGLMKTHRLSHNDVLFHVQQAIMPAVPSRTKGSGYLSSIRQLYNGK